MLLIGSILLLLANAVTLRRENILFNRVAILILLPILFIGSVQGCLFHSTQIVEILHLEYYKNYRTLVKWLGLTELLSIKEWVASAPLSSVAITLIQSVNCAFLFLFFVDFASHIGLIESAEGLLICSTLISVAKPPVDELCLAKQNKSLHPYFVTGFSDGEGYFTVSILKSKKHKTGWLVQPRFGICLHQRDREILESIQALYGGVGSITKNGKDCLQYQVATLQDLTNVILPYFEQYPLLTQKRADFGLFKEIVELMNRGEHLNLEGLQHIVNLRASINYGLSDELKVAFPNTKPATRPLVSSDYPEIQDPHWLAGFTAAEGCFFVDTFKGTTKTGFVVSLRFTITQHTRDVKLLKSIIKYFDCGRYKPRLGASEAGDFVITRLSDITEKILPFFDKYKIEGVKALDFADFKKVAEIMQTKNHLTESGLKELRLIKEGMNTGRLFKN